MEQAGLIRGYHADLGDGAGLVRAVLFIRIAERPCDRALDWLRAQEGVTSVASVASVAGEIDALATVSLPSGEELSALNDRIAASGLIADVQSHVLLRGSLRG
ncbi:MAG: Lrp/AsnC family transcriptional regulator [Paracoccus sp. (in: a-proteobacteria)]|nr:Lrp/AsnC family transcriptional regulator [Paracoccus sp. (in: a-proteobacteria)]